MKKSSPNHCLIGLKLPLHLFSPFLPFLEGLKEIDLIGLEGFVVVGYFVEIFEV